MYHPTLKSLKFLILLLPGVVAPLAGQDQESLLAGLTIVGAAEVSGGTPLRVSLTYTVDPGHFLPTFTTLSVDNSLGSPLEPTLVTQAMEQEHQELEIPTQQVRELQRVTLTALDGAVTKQVSFTVLPPQIASFELSPEPFESGGWAEGRVQLASPASPAGAAIKLSSSDPAMTRIPGKVFVAPGQSEVRFPVILDTTAIPRRIELAATLEPSRKTFLLTLQAPALVHLELDLDSMTGGRLVEGLVVLSSPAPVGGLPVQLRSGDSALAALPAQVRVQAGEVEARFTVATKPTAASRSVAIDATLEGVSFRELLLVKPPVINAVRPAAPGAIGGRPTRCAVELDGPAGEPIVVKLSSSRPELVALPPQVTVPARASAVDFEVLTSPVPLLESVEIEATRGGASRSAVFRVLPGRKGDWDGDGDVDLRDFARLQLCFEGARADQTTAPSRECLAVFDFDENEAIDRNDALAFEALLEGPDAAPRTRVELDPSLTPVRSEAPGWEAGSSRPVATLLDASGRQLDFVSNEILLVTDEPREVSSFIQRWGAAEVFSFEPRAGGAEAPTHHVLRVDTAREDGSRLEDDLLTLSPGSGGLLRVSSQGGLGLLGIAAREASSGSRIGVNWIVESEGIREAETLEAPASPSPFDGYSQNSFTWSHLKDHKVPQAWRALEMAGRLDNKVRIGIIDGGFWANQDWPAIDVRLSLAPGSLWGAVNPSNCGGGQPCPWHGTAVTSTAVGMVGNGYGAAGVAGPVAAGIVTIQSLGDIFTSVFAVQAAAAAGARIINMSFSTPVPASLSWTMTPFDTATALARNEGRLLFAAAGNKGEDIDSEDSFLGITWEDTWHAPCENAGVICVGGTLPGGWGRHPSSNYGARELDLDAPYQVWAGPDPGVMKVQPVAGTSVASPYAAGVAGLIWAADPTLSADQVESILLGTAYEGNGVRSVNAFDGVVRALGSQPPSIQILEPRDGGSYPETLSGTEISLVAAASDPEDGVPDVIWTSDLQGELGRGTAFLRSDLKPGTHVITARALDSTNLVNARTIVIRVQAILPSLWIFKPGAQTQLHAGQQTVLQAGSFDRAGAGGQIADSRVTWRSSLQGALGVGHLVTTTLREGNHTITVRGVSTTGAAGEARIAVTVKPPAQNPLPGVTITTPANGFRGPSDRVLLGSCSRDLSVAAIATDGLTGLPLPAGSITWITDRSDLQHPFLGSGPQTILNLAMKSCSETTVHMIRATVTDSRGNRVTSDPQRIEITAPPR